MHSKYIKSMTLILFCVGSLTACEGLPGGQDITQSVNVITGSQESDVELTELKKTLVAVAKGINDKVLKDVGAHIVSGSKAEQGIIMLDIQRMIASDKEFEISVGPIKERERDEKTVTISANYHFDQGEKRIGTVEYKMVLQQEGNAWKIIEFEPVGGDQLTVYRSLNIG